MAVELIVTADNEYQFKGTSRHITADKNKLLFPYGKMIHNYGVILEILPTEEQKQKLNQQIGNARFVKNRYLGDRIAYYNEAKETLSVPEYKKTILPKLKEEYPFLQLSDKFALEAAIESVDAAYQKFFQGAGFPKFASKYKPSGNKYRTKFTNNNIKLFIGEDHLPYIQLPKIGQIRFVLPKRQTVFSLVPNGTRILSASIKHIGKRYTVSLQLESVIDLAEDVKSISRSEVLAVDLGIKTFGYFGNDDIEWVEENPRWIKLHAKRLRRFQQALSRKKYNRKTHTGSKNWEKARAKVAKEQKKCADQRRDFHHKLSNKVSNMCKLFICEDLNVKGMIKNRHLSKAIASVGWAQFIRFVEYKMQRKGGQVVKISRWYPSSQLCSCCGYKNAEVKNLLIREWTCPKCGTYHDRDGNAKNNILNEGLKIFQEEYFGTIA